MTTCPICETCGTQFPAALTPPAHCPICEDERQYVGWSGQRWTTHEQLKTRFNLRIGEDDGLLAIAIDGNFAIPQRALLLPTGAGNILWECVSLVTDAALSALRASGGVSQIVISHPHFYSSMVEWSEALGGVPILLHGADQEWVQRPSPLIRYWSGDRLQLSDDVCLLRAGGHFPGSTVLHWRKGPREGGALFTGDALQVAMHRRSVAFMYSYPNHMPMASSDVRAMRALLADLEYRDAYGYSWGRNILGFARDAVATSFDQHLHAATR